jgi:penicillin-binding protein 2
MDALSKRKYILAGIFGLIGLLFILRLFYLQVIDTSGRDQANRQAVRHVRIFPPRGCVYDRNGKLLISNEVAYDLVILPADMDWKQFDTADFCDLLHLQKSEFIKRMNIPHYKESVFEKQLSPDDYGAIQERLYHYQGLRVQARTLRKYPQSTAAHLLGYIGEADAATIGRNSYYQDGDYIGISGIEKKYENVLRGKKGTQVLLRDVHQRNQGAYADGTFDTAAIPGMSLRSTLDIDLQMYGELLMKNKKGSIVAIEPSTGEVLALVTSPAYDPNLLIGKERAKNFAALYEDTLQVPLFNRATMASYPPGSTFKLIMALIAQQEGVLQPATAYPCNRGYPLMGGHPACHPHGSPLALNEAIGHSCNSYFSFVFKSVIENKKYSSIYSAYDAWRKMVMSFCMGQTTGSDIAHELKGNVPSKKYYDKLFGKGTWKASNVISLGIGQAEMLVTPLQNANLVAIIANKGWYYTPHILKSIGNNENDTLLAPFKVRHTTMVTDTAVYNYVISGMSDAVESGTAHELKVKNIDYCAKTGTAENPHGKSHSVFVAFAPKESPKIAIAVLVENAGAGSAYAGPIAALMLEKYLAGRITNTSSEKRILEADLIHSIQ